MATATKKPKLNYTRVKAAAAGSILNPVHDPLIKHFHDEPSLDYNSRRSLELLNENRSLQYSSDAATREKILENLQMVINLTAISVAILEG